MIVYRVVLKVSYHERWYEFNSATDASHFAMIMLNHEVPSEDYKEVPTEIIMKVVKKDEEKEECEDE